MVEQTRETRSLGVVWLYCPFPVLARGLIEILRGEASVYHGEQSPKGTDLSCILLATNDVEDIPRTMKRVQAAMPDTPIVVFGLDSSLPFAQAALQAGAYGFVHAGMPPEQVVRALAVASEGEIAVPRELLKDLMIGRAPVDLNALTQRQREILRYVIEGQTNAQIGQELFLSESTVKQHLRAAYKILKVRNRTEAAKLLRDKDI